MAMNLRRDEWPHLSRSWKIKEAPPCFPLPWGCLSVWMDFLNMDLLLLIYWLCQVFIAACRILVPQPRIEPWPPALRAHRLNHWITREIPTVDTFKSSYLWASQVALVVKNLPANAGDMRDAGLSHGWGRCPGEGHGNPLQYPCLENPMGRGAWRATVHRFTKSWTQLR